MIYHGLSTQEVNQRIQLQQVNSLAKDISKSNKEIIIDHCLTYFNFLNLFLACLILLTGRFVNMSFIGVIFFNTVIGIIQEMRVKNQIKKLEIITQPKIKVIRNNQIIEIGVNEIVLDDVVIIEAGQQVPSDGVVLESQGLELNESLLTGESHTIIKQSGDEVLAGTFVTTGKGIVKVIRVGDDNYSSSIASKAKKHKLVKSEMKKTIEKIIRILSIIIIPVGVLLFYSQYRVNTQVSEAIIKTVAGIVGMIPEGLVLLTSLSFILGVGRLAKKKALVQQMEAIEALSHVDTLCLDKTGTITTGELEVNQVLTLGDYSLNYIEDVMGSFIRMSETSNATQKALRTYFKENQHYLKKREIPFNSDRKYSAYEFENGRIFVLGAPDYLCHDKDVIEKMTYYMEKGSRVLLLGEALSMDEKKRIVSQITPMGLIVIDDVIKEDAFTTFRFFDKENVDIKVLSGDHPLTISQVCLKAGLKNADKYIDASQLPSELTELSKKVENYQIFGRVKPEQKELIIQALQNNGHKTAMVGDGVNDVLAIKQADCGIAMANGSDAAKQVADIVLMDSQFSSMIDIVKEGRTIIGNIERVSALYLTKTIYSTGLSLLFGLFGKQYPFTPFQLSIISGFAIGYPSFFMTLEKEIKVDANGFLSHVLHTALPCGLTIITYVLGIKIITDTFHIDNTYFLTYSYLTTVFISFIVLLLVCIPFNKRRMTLFSVLLIMAIVVIQVLSSYLNILPIISMETIPFMLIALSSIVVVMLYTYLIIKIKEHYYIFTKIINNKK